VAITVAAGKIGTYEQQLTANTILDVDFGDDVDTIEVVNSSGTSSVFFTVDGSAPTVGGQNCYYLPAAIGSKEVHPPTAGGTVVKLISSGTPTVSVAKA
jgi:hypothetical protein